MSEYKLAPSVPTDEMVNACKSINYLTDGECSEYRIYKAMLKDAPTLQEVDLHAIILAELNEYDLNGGNHYLANMLNKRIKQKHGKLYAEVK